jgi:hypothetical protein
MTPEKAIERLRRHAGLAEPNPQVPPDLALLLWHARQGRALGDVESAVDEIIQCLQAINPTLNGQSPEYPKALDALPRLVVCAISQICLDCTQAAVESRDESIQLRLLKAAWTVQSAWDAVAAGDIEDVAAHVKMEREARGL